jgi:hypothetical protein
LFKSFHLFVNTDPSTAHETKQRLTKSFGSNMPHSAQCRVKVAKKETKRTDRDDDDDDDKDGDDGTAPTTQAT